MSEKKTSNIKQVFLVTFSIAVVFAGITVLFGSSEQKHEPRTDMVEKAVFSGVPSKKMASVKFALSEILSVCTNIPKYAAHGENIHIYYYPEGWEATPAHIDVELNLDRESLQAMPQGLRDPQWGGHVELGLSGGKEPGAIMEMPLPLWLCGLPVDPAILSSSERHWDQEKRFMPLPNIPSNSF